MRSLVVVALALLAFGCTTKYSYYYYGSSDAMDVKDTEHDATGPDVSREADAAIPDQVKDQQPTEVSPDLEVVGDADAGKDLDVGPELEVHADADVAKDVPPELDAVLDLEGPADLDVVPELDVSPELLDVGPEQVDIPGEQDVCVPACEGKVCGGNGCPEGSCGECDNSNPCDGLETCSADQTQCLPGEPKSCDDQDPCTEDGCNETTGDCTNEPVPDEPATTCDDSNPCTGPDKCMQGLCTGPFLPLIDLLAAGCFCAENEECTKFEDDDVCNGTLFCDKEQAHGLCAVEPTTVVLSCDDQDPCTDDECDKTSGCLHTANDANICADADQCNGIETCQGGKCIPGEAPLCGDSNPCTDDSCDAATGCVSVPDDTNQCADADKCNGQETCQSGSCVPGEVPVCEDYNPCTDDACDMAFGCQYLPDDTNSCQDTNVCNGIETCSAGTCDAGTPLTCDDGNLCTDDSCDPGIGCQFLPNTAACDDGDSCTVGDKCAGGKCQSGDALCDLDHDGLLNVDDACPLAFDPANPDMDGDTHSDACEPLSAHGTFAQTRPLKLTQDGQPSPWRRTHEPVEVPLRNGIIEDSVAGYWKLDGTAADFSGKGHTGTAVGGLDFGPGPFGAGSTAGNFTGGYLDFDKSMKGVNPVQAMTVMAWVAPASLASKSQSVVAKWSVPGSPANASFWLGIDAQNAFAFWVSCAGSAYDAQYVSAGTQPQAQVWSHVAGVFNNGRLDIFVDGRLDTDYVGGDAQGCVFDSTGVSQLRIAAQNGSPAGNLFEGRMDDVLLFERALTPTEIAAYYQSHAPYGTTFVPGAQADFDDVRIVETPGAGEPGNAYVTRSRILGPRPHSDTPCPKQYDGKDPKEIPGIADRDDLCGVVGYWKLDGNGAATIGAKNGTVVGALATVGRYGEAGGALAFANAPSTYVQVDKPELTLDQGTIEAWVFPVSCTGAAHIVVQKNIDGLQGDASIFLSNAQPPCSIRFGHDGKGGPHVELTAKSPVRLGIWTHVAATWDGTRSRLFVDGMEQDAKDDTGGLETLAEPIMMGCDSGKTNHFHGRIDDVLIHKVAKSADYIYHRANPGVPTLQFLGNTVSTNQGTEQAPKYPFRQYDLSWGDSDAGMVQAFVPRPGGGAPCAGLLNDCLGYAGWWRFNEGSGSIAVDSSRWKNNGGLVGAVDSSAWTAGAEGTALYFGPNHLGRVVIANGDSVQSPSSALGVEAVVALDPKANSFHCLVGKPYWGGSGLDYLTYGLSVSTSDLSGQPEPPSALLGYAVTSKGWLSVFSQGGVVPEDQKWRSLGMSYLEPQIEVWTPSGQSVAEASGTLAYQDYPLYLGVYYRHTFEDFVGALHGKMDSVRLMSRALTPDEFLHYPMAGWEYGKGNWTLDCGGVICPELAGYNVSCNPQDHCEYERSPQTEPWHKWDVWIYVPPGSFQMGCPPDPLDPKKCSEFPDCPGYELPQHPVSFDYGYFIGKYEIVVEQYEACMLANQGTCTTPSDAFWPAPQGVNTSAKGKSGHPQNGLSWEQAESFCSWVAPGARLPTEAEWEYAATGPVHRKYPWGDSPGPGCLNNTSVAIEGAPPQGYGCGSGGTMKVGSMPAGASWCGALDMSGNVGEWLEDWWHPNYEGAPGDGSAWLDPPGSLHVGRGNAFHDGGVCHRTAYRWLSGSDAGWAIYGGRCVRPAE